VTLPSQVVKIVIYIVRNVTIYLELLRLFDTNTHFIG